MFNFKKLFILWLFIAMVAFSSCSNNGGAVDPGDDVGSGEGEVPNGGKVDEDDKFQIEISSVGFMKITGLKDPNNIGRESPCINVIEYRVGDTMVILCKALSRFGSSYYYDIDRDGPLPIVAKVTSSKTGDVQHITFVKYPFWIWVAAIMNFHIAYISPVKSEIDKLLPDTTREELKVSPNGDIITAEIKYKDTIIIKSITVRGE